MDCTEATYPCSIPSIFSQCILLDGDATRDSGKYPPALNNSYIFKGRVRLSLQRFIGHFCLSLIHLNPPRQF